MSSRSGKKRPQQSDPVPSAPEGSHDPADLEAREPGNGALEEETGGDTAVATEPEEPAQVQLTIKGSDKSARAAAKRFGGEVAAKPLPPVATPANDMEPSDDDPIAVLLSSGKNMVLVMRQTPRTFQGPDGAEHATNVRIPGTYSCPTSKAEIEQLVFDQHGGKKYKCTIHPDTSDGPNKILGHFTIEHSDPKCPPFIDGVTINVPEPEHEMPEGFTKGSDPTARETDQLAGLKARLTRRLDRAQNLKEIKEMEKLVQEAERELENDGKPTAPAPSVGESDEVRKLREQIAAKDRELAEKEKLLSEKKVNDRFDRLETAIAELAKVGATAKPAAEGETFAMQMLKQSQQHSKDMLTLIQAQTAPKPATTEDNLDKFLDRVTKLQAVTGTGASKGSGRLSSLEEKLIDMSFDRLTSGSGGGDEESEGDVEDAVKLAIKQFAPIAKTYVEKKMDQENAATGGGPLPKEVVQKIYAEAAQAAAKKVQDDLAIQGLQLSQTTDGRLVALAAPKGAVKHTVPPRSPGTRLVSETRTAGGVVKKVSIKPDNLSEKPKIAAEPPAPPPEPMKGETEVPKCGVFPMIGPNGTTLNIPFPARPGEMKYDRKESVNFILDGIRSEIRQGVPKKAQTDQTVESYVLGDALDYLDDEILDQLDGIDSGAALEALLAPSGDAEKIAEIKKAGDDEVVASYLRKLVMGIQREWQREKGAPSR